MVTEGDSNPGSLDCESGVLPRSIVWCRHLNSVPPPTLWIGWPFICLNGYLCGDHDSVDRQGSSYYVSVVESVQLCHRPQCHTILLNVSSSRNYPYLLESAHSSSHCIRSNGAYIMAPLSTCSLNHFIFRSSCGGAVCFAYA